MNLSQLKRLNRVFGEQLRSVVGELGGDDVNVTGGGLRHGTPEWRVSFHAQGLRRLLAFELDSPYKRDLRVSVHVAATDGEGGWVQRTLPSEITRGPLSSEILRDQGWLYQLVRAAWQEARALHRTDLQFPSTWFVGDTDQGDQ